ncbi:phosphate acyltransferase PlsX [Cupriavidus numazuensis]|uniref:Phosphate acyltransferase n=1 Tax=Cupriavidus numazuensis TaxID=221992 RepID=A0ABM8TCV4_9BURK|nr:phosphate acyltransferase PlsX [Cupriavidus numazuensis]CAG2137147.1 Phosphate acyltransferase [Cupriavidus numazuensis]
MTIKIAIDCMGGDHGVSVTVPAAISFLSSHDDAAVVLVGLPDAIQAQLKKLHAQHHPRVSVVPATEVITMDDPVEVALRKKKDSSMRVAVTQVKEGLAGACISAGNTGALMAVSRYVLKTLEGIERPAIATTIPNDKGWGTTVLDLGANADCEPEHLLQFARMAEAMVAVVDHKEHPTVGLLNIGEEVIKGNEVVKRAGELLRASELNFHGNVEGNDIFKGTTDIVVCDGFVGNVALKSTEGLAKMIGGMIKEEFTRSWFTKLLAGIAMPVLSRLAKRLDPARYNGASLLGLRGLVIKSHGSADAHSFEWAIKRGYDAAKNGVIERIARAFADKTSAAGAAPASPETAPTPHPSTRAA